MSESDDWRIRGDSVLLPEILERIGQVTRKDGPVILEHKFYRGGRGPKSFVFDDLDELLVYLKANAHPGDKFYIWNMQQVCREDNRMSTCKYPDADGRTPQLGSY